MEAKEVSVFDESFELLIKPRRISILPTYLKIMTGIGLLLGLIVTIPFFGFLAAAAVGDARTFMSIAVMIVLMAMLTFPIFLMHLLVFLEWKWAIRFHWAGLVSAVIIIGGNCLMDNSMSPIIFIITVFYIFYFFKIFSLKKKWEDGAVSRWKK